MKQKEVFKKIGGIIKELNDQYEYLQSVKEDLNDLELELFVSNAHFLTDHIEILRKLNLQATRINPPAQEKKEPVTEIKKEELPEAKKELSAEITSETLAEVKKESVREEKYFEPMVQQMKPTVEPKPYRPFFRPAETKITPTEPEEQPEAHIDISGGRGEDTYSFIRESEPETIRHELILDESQNWEDDDEDLRADELTEIIELPEEEIPVAAEPVIEPVRETVFPVISNPVARSESGATEEKALTINQKMSAKLADKAAAKTEQQIIKPISDIKLAITLNDKLLYVKDLFNGYNLAYSEAIEILNRFNTFEEASRFLNANYVVKNNWEGKPVTTEKFYALLRRRYA